jgi:hypothetical protein
MPRKPIFQFRVWTDGPVDGGPGEVTYEEGVWELDEESPDHWEPKGPKLGIVIVNEMKPKPSNPGHKDFVAKFTVTDAEGTRERHITVKGMLPHGLDWKGRGPAGADDDDDRAHKNIAVEGRNPKRWG